MYVNKTIVKTDGTPIRMAILVGSPSTVLQGTGLLNNSEMDMTFVLLKGHKRSRVLFLRECGKIK